MSDNLAHTQTEPALVLTQVSKRFPGVRALHRVDLALRAGEVMALIGENGAGKSTLVKILTGIYTPDEGLLLVDGRPHKFTRPADATMAGITAIHQETVMFDELSVTENIFMGHMPTRTGGRVDWVKMRAQSAELLARIDADFTADTVLKRLGVAQKHLVEIARALSHDARIIIMDEPTAALSTHEIDHLFSIIAQLKAQGQAILFISHKFDEIFRIADRWTCLRDGQCVGAGDISSVTPAELVSLMVGRAVDQVFPKRQVTFGDIVLEVHDLANSSEFDGACFDLRAGEILGFYGLVGAGRSELMQALFGVGAITRGSVKVEGRAIRLTSPADAIAAGIAYVPEDRQVQGAILPFSIRENTTLAILDTCATAGVISRAAELAVTKTFGQRLMLRATHWEQRLGDLSGGNQQKVVVGKWLASAPRILILDEPTKGIDIGSKAAVHEFIGELAREGLAIILVSSELPEVMGMADSIQVMHAGSFVQRFSRAEATPEAIVRAASGLVLSARDRHS